MPGGPVRSVYIGRQPIYDRSGVVAAYELLFRGGAEASEAARRGVYATSQVIVNAFTEFGVRELVGDRLCFINLTREFLVGELLVPFEPAGTVLEILETITVDDAVVAGVARLAEQGYTIALDDFVWGLGHERLLSLASYVKVDLLEYDREAVANVLRACHKHPQIRLVAERLETEKHIERARALGFDFFQGYALARPQVVTTSSLSPSRLRRIELLGALTAEDVNIEQVVSIIMTDPALAFRVLRATNAASSGLTRRISAVRDAVTLLGITRIRHWVTLMVVSDVTRADEAQLTTTLTRARLCQIVAERFALSGDAAFTVGLLSGVADLLAIPLSEIATRLPITKDVADALVSGDGRLGEVLNLVRAYENRDPDQVMTTGNVSMNELATAYLAALGWSVRTVGGMTQGALQRTEAS